LAIASRDLGDLFDLRLQLLWEVDDLLADINLQRIIEISAKVHNHAR
jgi:hypothetical protein